MTVDQALITANMADYEVASKGEIEALKTLAAAVMHVRELHIPFTAGYCQECGKDYPCPTIAALVGPS